jgi:hypothetical protein
MPGGEDLRAVAASSLGHEDHIHEEPVEPVEPRESDNKHIMNCRCKGWG